MNTAQALKEEVNTLWLEREEEIDERLEQQLVKTSYVENDNYIGYIEICYNKSEDKYSIEGIVRLNNFKGLPKINILSQKEKRSNWIDIFMDYIKIKHCIQNFMF